MANRIEKNRIFIYVAIAISLLSDAFSIAILLIGGIDPIYDLFMIGITVFDLLMIVGMRFSNPRVRSTILLYVLYAAFVSGAVIGMTVLFGFTYVDRIMTTISAAAFLVSHLFTVLMTVLICVGSRFDVKALKKGRLIVQILLSTVVTAAYVGCVFFFGFFGQGMGNRELLFSYDEATDSYQVTGVTPGRSKKVVIPDSFDGKPVSAVSASIFDDGKITDVTIEKRSERLTVLFSGKESFAALESLRTFNCSKDDVDSIKRQFYAQGTDAGFVAANLLVPSDLAEDEVFISFALDREFTEATGDYLRTWIQPRGTVFSIDFDGTTEYSVHSDPDRVEDLEWSYLSNNGVLLTGVYDGNAKLDGVAITENVVGAVLHYDRVYRVVFDADNDAVYDLPQEITRDKIGGQFKDYRYVLLSRADELFGLCDRRGGFSLRFLVGGSNCPSLATYLRSHPEKIGSDVHVVPEWTMDPVAVTGIGIAAGSTAPSLSEILYGDDVALQCAATGLTEGFTVSYLWSDPGNADLHNDSDVLHLNNIYPTQAGTYAVTVKKTIPTSSLSVSDTATVTIPVNPKPLAFEWTSAPSVVYSGTEQVPSAAFNSAQVINGDAVTFTITVDGSATKQIKDAGTYQLKAVLPSGLTAKYKAENAAAAMTVTRKPAQLVWDTDVYTYDGESHRPVVSDITGVVPADNAATLISSITYSGTAGKNYRTADYSVSANVAALANYSFATTVQSYAIEKREITILGRDTDAFTYNAKEQYTKVTGLGNVVEGEEAATLGLLIYTRAGGSVPGSSKNAGDYTVTVSLPDVCNYAFRGDVVTETAFHVDTTPLTITANNKTVTYGAAIPTYTVTYDGFVSGETKSVLGGSLSNACVYAVGTGVGSYSITPSGLTSGNYEITFVPGTLTVNKKALSVTAANKSVTYGSAAPTYTASYSGFAAGDTAADLDGEPAFTCSYVAGNGAGSYSIGVSGITSPNYEITFTAGTLTVNRKTLTIKAENKSVIYGDAAPAYTVSYSGFVLGETAADLGGALQYACAYAVGSGAGNYPITPSGYTSSNYQITFTAGSLTVNKKALTVTAENKAVTYGDAKPTYTVTYDGFVAGDGGSKLGGTLKFSCVYAVGTGVGNYAITPSGLTSGNYAITFVPGTLNVGKKALTVKADNKTVTYGAAKPTFTATYVGLAAGDTAASLNDSPEFACTYAAGSGVGSYTITPSGVAAENYDVSFTSGTLTVNKKALTVKADNKVVTYGSAAPTYTVSYSGFVLGENKDDLGGSLELACTYAVGNGAGSYAITPSGYTSSNYQITFTAGNLTVNKKTLTVTAENKAITYGDAAPAYTVSYVGFVLGETEADLGGALQYACAYAVGSGAGNYPITPSGLTSLNYQITYVSGTLNVGKKALTVKADDKIVAYGDAKPTFTATYVGLTAGDTAGSLGGKLSFACSYESGSPVGSYPISVSGLTSSNYSISYQNGNLTVEVDS